MTDDELLRMCDARIAALTAALMRQIENGKRLVSALEVITKIHHTLMDRISAQVAEGDIEGTRATIRAYQDARAASECQIAAEDVGWVDPPATGDRPPENIS